MNERKREEEKSIFSCADKNTKKKFEKLASETIYVKEHNRKSRKKNQFFDEKKKQREAS